MLLLGMSTLREEIRDSPKRFRSVSRTKEELTHNTHTLYIPYRFGSSIRLDFQIVVNRLIALERQPGPNPD